MKTVHTVDFTVQNEPISRCQFIVSEIAKIISSGKNSLQQMVLKQWGSPTQNSVGPCVLAPQRCDRLREEGLFSCAWRRHRNVQQLLQHSSQEAEGEVLVLSSLSPSAKSGASAQGRLLPTGRGELDLKHVKNIKITIVKCQAT